MVCLTASAGLLIDVARCSNVSAGLMKSSAPDGEKGAAKVDRVSEEQNNESQKQKVCQIWSPVAAE